MVEEEEEERRSYHSTPDLGGEEQWLIVYRRREKERKPKKGPPPSPLSPQKHKLLAPFLSPPPRGSNARGSRDIGAPPLPPFLSSGREEGRGAKNGAMQIESPPIRKKDGVVVVRRSVTVVAPPPYIESESEKRGGETCLLPPFLLPSARKQGSLRPPLAVAAEVINQTCIVCAEKRC